MNPKRKLSDILHASERESLSRAWGQTKAAEDFAPLPAGEYVAHITEGALDTTKAGKPEYRLTFRVVEGDFAERRFWHHVYLTPAALPMAKRDLNKLGVTDLAQLDNPLPSGIRCRVKLALRRDDDGNENNRVRSFDVLGIDKEEPEAFAPKDDKGDAWEPPSDLGTAGNGEAKGALFAVGTDTAAGPYLEGR